jgi:subtilase family serine protease
MACRFVVFKRVVSSFFGFSCLLMALSPTLASDTIDRGVAYLESIQQPDGSWSESERKLVGTCEAVKALLACGAGTDALYKALPFANGLDETDTEHRARKLIMLANSTADTADLRQCLLDEQNPDGGWGLAPGKQSTAVDTVTVLEALLASEPDATLALSNARDYLVSQQDASGTWILAEEETTSSLTRTAQCLRTLKTIERQGLSSIALSNAMDKAAAYLDGKCAVGDFGGVLANAFCCLALIAVRQPAELQATFFLLQAAQQADGSWEHDAFTTAVVLQALQAVQPPSQNELPDLAVQTNAIVFSPAQPEQGDEVTISATVFNQGTAEAREAAVEFFDRDPRLGGAQIGESVNLASIPADGSATAAVQLDTSALLASPYVVVVVDRANTIQESSEINNAAAKAMPLAVAPDLAITSADLSFSTDSPQAFDRVEIRAKLTNAGGAFTDCVTIRFADNGSLLKDVLINAIPAGQTTIVTLATGFAAGEHAISANIDPENVLVSESDKSDNLATKSLTVLEIPESPADLVVESITFDPVVPADSAPVTITIDLINLGGADITAPFVLTVFDGSTEIHEFTVATLADSQKASLSLTTTLTTGVHTIRAVADPANLVAERDETNNSRQEVVTAVSTDTPANLEILAFTASPSSVTEGSEMVLSAELKNSGTTQADQINVAFFDGALQVGDFTVPSLPGGGTASLQLHGVFATGLKTFKVSADPSNRIAESDETDNTATALATIQAVDGTPDFAVNAESIAFSNSSPMAFETFDISIKINNIGNGLGENVPVRFEFDGAVAANLVLPSIPVGKSIVASLTDVALPKGDHDITVAVDPDHVVTAEVEQTNNSATTTFTVLTPSTSPADLVVESIEIVPATVLADQEFLLNVAIINMGGTTAAEFAIAVTANGTALGSFTVSNLGGGQRALLTTASLQLPAGVWTLRTTADPGNAVAESREDNNETSKILTIAANQSPADLKITKIEISAASPAAGELLTLTFTVANSGTTSANNVAIRLFDNATPLANDVTLSLAGRQTACFQMHTTLSSGSHQITAIIDPTNAISESDETNNTSSTTIDVQTASLPDLCITPAELVFSNPAPIPGETIQISATVTNTGTLDATACKLLFTVGDPYVGGAQLIAEPELPALAPGASTSVSADFTIPSEGPFAIHTVADSGNANREADYKNNAVSAVLNTAPLPDLYVSASSLSFSHTDLAEGQTVAVSLLVSNLGEATSSSCQGRLLLVQSATVASLVGTIDIPSIETGKTIAQEVLWRPGPGTSTLRFEVDTANTLAESDETNNSVEQSVTILAPESILNIQHLTTGGGFAQTNSFSAYETAYFELIHPFSDAVLTGILVSPDGTLYPINTTQVWENRIPFMINALPPAESTNPENRYQAIFQIIQASSGAVLDTVSGNFNILTTKAIRDASATATPAQARQLARELVTLSVELTNGANSETNGQISWCFNAPDGSPIAQGLEDITLMPTEIYQKIQLHQLNHTFGDFGSYTLEASVFIEGEVVKQVQDEIQIIPEGMAALSPSQFDLTLSQGQLVEQNVTITRGQGETSEIYDVVFLFDISGSFDDDISAFRTQAQSIMTAMTQELGDVQFGVTTFSDFPFEPWGDSWIGDEAFYLDQPLTADTSQVQNVLTSIYTRYGNDGPESQLEALYQTATGAGRDINNDGDFDDKGELQPTNIGWRRGSRRIIFFATDAEFHKNTDTGYEVPQYPGPSCEETIAALTDNGIAVVGLLADSSWGTAYDDTAKIVTGTEAVKDDGSPLIFYYSSSGSSITEAMLNALPNAIKVSLTLQTANDEHGFYTTCNPEESPRLGPEEIASFSLTFKGTIEQDFEPKAYDFDLEIWENNTLLVNTIPVQITVPAKAPLVVETDKETYATAETAQIKTSFSLPPNGSVDMANPQTRVDLTDVVYDGVEQSYCLAASKDLPPLRDLVVNGEFEDGLTGWFYTDSWDGAWYTSSYAPLAGSWSAIGSSCGGTATLSQEVSIPQSTLSATLTFTDTISYCYSGTYSLTITDASGNLLKSLRNATSDSAQATYSFDISEFAGMTVVIVFKAPEAEVKVDNVQLLVQEQDHQLAGTARYVFDAEHPVTWNQLHYEAITDDETSLSFKIRSGDTAAELAAAKWLDLYGNGATIPSETATRFLEIEVLFSTADPQKTPDLKGLYATCYDYNGNPPLELVLTINDQHGEVAHLFDTIYPTGIPNSTQNHTFSFDTSTVIPGNYQAVGNLRLNGELISQNADSFSIVNQPLIEVIQGDIATDRQVYCPGETVDLISKIINTTNNIPVADLEINITVKPANDATLFTKEWSLPHLLPGTKQVDDLLLVLANLGPQTCTVTQTVSQNDKQLLQNTASFEIVSSITLGKGLAGTLALSPNTINYNDALDISANVHNTGNVDLADVEFLVEIFDSSTAQVLKRFSDTRDLPVSHSEDISLNFVYESVPFACGVYPVSLRAIVPWSDGDLDVPLDITAMTLGNTLPTAIAGPDQTLPQALPGGALATLDASNSTDPDSTNATAMNDDIVSYRWSEGDTLLGEQSILVHTFPLGVHDLTLTITDKAGATASDSLTITVVDLTPPTTTDDYAHAHEWVNQDVTVHLTAIDNPGGSGVSETTCCLNNTRASTGTCFQVSAEGTTVVTYHSCDFAGNIEPEHTLTVLLDKTAPIIACENLTIAEGEVVNLTATAIDNLDPTPVLTWSHATSGVAGVDFPVGTTTLTVSATDAAGNTSTAQTTVTVTTSETETECITPDIPDDLILYYPFDEGIASADIAIDHSGNHNHGTIAGAEFSGGVICAGLALDGTGNHTSAPDSHSLDLTDTITIALWLRIPTPDSDRDMVLLSKKASWLDGTGYALVYNPATGILQMLGAGDNIAWAAGIVLGSDWHHLVITIEDNGSPWQHTTFYVDSVDMTFNHSLLHIKTNDCPFRVGGFAEDNTELSDLHGTVDEVRIYNRTLTSNEIQLLASFHDANPNQAPLVDAGPDRIIRLPETDVTLAASVTDDGLPPTPSQLSTTWTQLSGPGNVVFADLTNPVTTATFDTLGTYVLRLSATDTKLQSNDTLTVTVLPAAEITPPIDNPSYDEGLFAHWNFEETTGATVIDTINGHDGIIHGATRDTGKVGTGALRFNGESDYVDLGTLDVPAATDAFTIALWFQADDFGTSDARLISKATNTAGSKHYWMLSTILDNGHYRLRFRLRTYIGDTTTLTAQAGELIPGQWTHAVATYDGAAMRLYQNGNLVGTTPKIGTVRAYRKAYVRIGDNPVGNRFFDGLIDDVRLYTRALSETEIANQANSTPGDSATPENAAPTVNAGSDRTLTLPTCSLSLQAILSDDGQPSPPADLTCSWQQLDGPGTVVFSNPTNPVTTVTFDMPGTYHLEVSATDGELETSDSLTVTVLPEATAEDPPNEDPIPDPTLFAHWNFDEITGATAVDTSGNGHDGTIHGATHRSGKIGTNALYFDGINDHVDLGTLDVPAATSAFSIALWFKADDFGTADARLISKATNTAGSKHYWMLSTIRDGDHTRLRFRLRTYIGATTTLIADAGYLIPGQWIHAVGTYDGTAMRLYQDGVQVGIVPKTGTVRVYRKAYVRIGDNPIGDRFFHGLIDDIRLYTRALNPDDIASLIQQATSP